MRTWKNSGQDDGSLHCLGNGRLCVYEQGPNLVQVFGPPYSGTAFFKRQTTCVSVTSPEAPCGRIAKSVGES